VEAGATTRASFYLYNDRDDVDALVEGLRYTGEFFNVGAPTLAGTP
jgi:selenocysteine lyase/cysteine desulfurase